MEKETLEGQKSTVLLKRNWPRVRNILLKDFDLHKYTIFYGCCWEDKNVEECWAVTPLFRT